MQQPSKTVYIVTGNPDTLNVSPTDYTSLGSNPGELGQTFISNQNRGYQLVQVDSGATAATPTGVIAAGQLAYWKDRSVYLVTNDSRMAIGGQTSQGFANEVAGIFRNAVTARDTVNGIGTVCAILQQGNGVNVATPTTLTSANFGDAVVANTSTPRANATNSAAGTAAPNRQLGTWVGASASSLAAADINIVTVPQ